MVPPMSRIKIGLQQKNNQKQRLFGKESFLCGPEKCYSVMRKAELLFCTLRWQSQQSWRQYFTCSAKLALKMSHCSQAEQHQRAPVTTFCQLMVEGCKPSPVSQKTSSCHPSTSTVSAVSALQKCFCEQSFIFKSIANTYINIWISNLCKSVLGAAIPAGGILQPSGNLLGGDDSL